MFEIVLFFIVSVVIGLMFLFFGYPFFRILLPIWGFFVGLMFGLHDMQAILGHNIIAGGFGLFIGLFLGLLLALLAYFIYSVAVYFFGLSIGYVLGAGLVQSLGWGDGFMSGMVGVVMAIAFVVLFATIKAPKFLIILLTAAGGAMAVIMGLLVLFGRVPEVFASLQLTQYIVSNSFFWLIAWAILAGVGMCFQYALVQVANEDLRDPYVWGKTAKKKKK
jgi:hypothetical protein